jgi:hypothetical protein
MEIVVSAPSGRLGPERWNGDNSEVLSVRGQLLVLDADAPSDRAASLGLERAQLGLERAARPSVEMWWGGLAGHGLAVVVDDLDVVAVRVEHEGAVIARVVHGARAGGAVVLVARGERGGVEGPHRGVRVRREREVDVLRKRALVAHEREGEVGAGELHAIRRVVRQAEPGVRLDEAYPTRVRLSHKPRPL